jgi:hypothetical protein
MAGGRLQRPAAKATPSGRQLGCGKNSLLTRQPIPRLLGQVREVHDMDPLSHIAAKMPAKQLGEVRFVIDDQDADVRVSARRRSYPQSGFPDGSAFQNMILSK